ncbi:hypothetical protein ACFFP0_24235 [Rhizobium puerariae]|uniref:Helix-turn-helix domain-containing protein n=1 Tax=Rhizobium puerariae TaxID=1585791 RepID=A0ABV6APE7_9HYPH
MGEGGNRIVALLPGQPDALTPFRLGAIRWQNAGTHVRSHSLPSAGHCPAIDIGREITLRSRTTISQTDATAASDDFVSTVISLLGIAAWQQLRSALGGQTIKVPQNLYTLHDRHRLVEAIGFERARMFCKHFSGEKIYIPRNGRPNRDHEYVAMASAGMTNRQIAEAMGVTDRQVRRILSICGTANAAREIGCRAGGPKIDPAELPKVERYIKLLIDGEIRIGVAASRLGVLPDTLRGWKTYYVKHGTLRTVEAGITFHEADAVLRKPGTVRSREPKLDGKSIDRLCGLI